MAFDVGFWKFGAALAVVTWLSADSAAAASALSTELPPLVRDIGIALLLSGALAIISARIKFPAIAGYILGGVVAGPMALNLIADPANIETIAELGFILLLFVIGLEMDVRKILQSGRTVIATGLLHVPLIVVFGLAVAKVLAMVGFGAIIGDQLGSLYIGLIISLSSTLLVIKLFQENFELDTLPGRVALGILVIEDLWAIIIIILQPSLAHPEILPILGSFAGIILLAALTYVMSRSLIPVAFRWIAKLPEIVLVGAIAWCFAIIFLGGSFDVVAESVLGVNPHLSVGAGMGALIAGATIASLPYSVEIITKVNVVKDFLITFFFVGLGLSIPAPSGVAVFGLAAAIAVASVASRQLILLPLLYWTGVDRRNAEVTAVRMSQISEFGLIITFLGVSLDHVSSDLATAIILAFVLTALATTPLYHSAYRIHDRLGPTLTRLGFKVPPKQEGAAHKNWRVAILGFHRVASSLLYTLARDDPELVKQTLVIDFNISLHGKIRATGAHVEYGDLSNPDTLHHAGVDRTDVVVSTVSDDLLRGTSNERIVDAVRRLNPTAIIIANAVNLADVDAIQAAGADYVFMSRLDSAAALGEAIKFALNGEIADFRASRDRDHGLAAARREVLE